MFHPDSVSLSVLPSPLLQGQLMLYDRPIYRPLGDMFVDVEFGDELHLALNFRVIGLNLSLADRPIAGVTETVPSNRALMIAYDSSIIRQAVESFLA